MKEKTIKVLMVAPREHPKETTLVNELDDLQKAVSIGAEYQGLIEIIPLGNNICLLCNEEGKLIHLEGNRRVGRDIIAGVFYICSEDEEGNLCSLSEDDTGQYKKRRKPTFFAERSSKSLYNTPQPFIRGVHQNVAAHTPTVTLGG